MFMTQKERFAFKLISQCLLFKTTISEEVTYITSREEVTYITSSREEVAYISSREEVTYIKTFVNTISLNAYFFICLNVS